ncbi:SpoIIE family protein phosphatase [Streptomyces ficellus]|uniref:SpoIIE family protein phosphatase n=1 Tax=Streptomyces ficellus TaxID=1977088 RepID=UPI003CC6E2CF
MGSLPTQRASAGELLLPPHQPPPGQTVTRTSLPGNPLAPAAARRFTRAALADWTGLGLPAAATITDRVADDAVLVAGELVTNAVVHAGTTVELLFRLEDPADGLPAALVLEVSDHHPTRTVRQEHQQEDEDGLDEYGRGLRLVASLAECWGITYRPGLKTVWARLPLDGWDTCPVPGAEPAIQRGLRAAEILAPVPRRVVRDDQEWDGRGALSFLAEASDLLAGQLDEDLVAALAGQLLVPRLADWCAFWLEDEGTEGGGPRLARVWHADESALETLRGVLEKEPPRMPEPPRPGPVPIPWPSHGLHAADGRGSAPTAGSAGDEPGGPGVSTDTFTDTFTDAGTAAYAGADSATGTVAEAAYAGAPGGTVTDARAHGGAEARAHGVTGAAYAGAHGCAPTTAGRGAATRAEDAEDRTAAGPEAAGTALAYRLVVGGHGLGTLMLGRRGRGRVPDAVTTLVEDFARRVALAIGAARRYTRQVTISRILQRGLLPSQVAQIPGVESRIVYEPSDDGLAGGDFYDVFQAGPGARRWCFMLGDVQGSGPEAAVVTGLARPWLRLLAREDHQVGHVLDRLNRLLLDDATEAAEAAASIVAAAGDLPGAPPPAQPQSRFLSLLYGELVPLAAEDGGGARCTLACAGHPLPLLLRPDGSVTPAAVPQVLLGVVDDVGYESHTFHLAPGDTLLCVTDGVTERRSRTGRMFDDGDGLAEALSGCAGLPAREVADRIRQAVHTFGEAPVRDDLALLVLQAR